MDDTPATTTGADDEVVVVAAPAGALRGRWLGGVARFAGIPFAEAPTGPRRFRPPVAPAPWDGVRDALHFGAVSPQNPSMMDALFGGETEVWDEDCLHLNVWSTSPGDATAGRPVMVWIHGGGFEMGSGSSPLYHGESFARSGVVYVSINYRLGSLGFLELGHLDDTYAGSGNVGLLDQVAALRWVRDNIGVFGGDPDNVTVFGESAGAMSVSTLMCMPDAAGLFHKVIAQSGSVASAKSPEQAERDTAEFMEEAGVTNVAELVDLPVSELLGAHSRMGMARLSVPEDVIQRFGSPLAVLPFRPVADGRSVPTDPLGAIAGGCAAGVPLVIGTNLEEWKLFALLSPPTETLEALRERLALLTEDPDGALAAYQGDHPEAPPAALEQAVLTDYVFRIPACALADAQAAHAPVWQYRFDWRSPALGGLLGAAHAVEIPFVFDMVEDHRLHVLVGAEAPAGLARTMHDAWVATATHSDPAGAGVAWPQVDGPGRPVLCLDDEHQVRVDPQSATRRFWSGG
jgi:para-nitrobenzyl esterase